jgi:mRNA interferase MazF
VKRGEIWWAGLPSRRGSEPAYRRPVVIVSSDAFNCSRIQTVIVAAITSNLRLADAPGNVRLSRRQSRLPRESVINVSQLLTLDRGFVSQRVGKLPKKPLAELDAGLSLALAI